MEYELKSWRTINYCMYNICLSIINNRRKIKSKVTVPDNWCLVFRTEAGRRDERKRRPPKWRPLAGPRPGPPGYLCPSAERTGVRPNVYRTAAQLAKRTAADYLWKEKHVCITGIALVYFILKLHNNYVIVISKFAITYGWSVKPMSMINYETNYLCTVRYVGLFWRKILYLICFV